MWQGIPFSRHAVNTRSATPAALRVACSVCPDAAQSYFAWAPTQYFPVLSVQTFGFHSAHTSVPCMGIRSYLTRCLPCFATRARVTLLRDAILHRLKVQDLPSMASPFVGQIVHWTICFFRLTHGEPVRPVKAPLALFLVRPHPWYTRQRPFDTALSLLCSIVQGSPSTANPFGRKKCPPDISSHPPHPWPPTFLKNVSLALFSLAEM